MTHPWRTTTRTARAHAPRTHSPCCRAVSDAERDPAPLLPDDDEPGGSCLVPLVVVIGVPTWMVIGYVLLGMVAR